MEGLGINFKSKKTAIIDGNKKISYAELKENILKTLSYLQKKKISSNSKVLVSLDNSAEYVYLYFALILNNSIIIPINKRDYLKSKINIIKYLSPDLIIDNKKKLDEIYKYRETNTDLKFDSNKVFSIFFSSGTEGDAKGITHSYLSLRLSAENFIKHNNLNNFTIFLQFLPLSYMAGFLNSILCILLVNGTIIINKNFDFKFLINFPNLIEKFKINTIWLTPSNLLLINEMYSEKNIIKKIKTLKKIFVGTAPLNIKDKDNFENKFKKKIYNSYGLSEVLFISCANKENHKGVGKILKNQILKINKKKEILIKNNTIFKYYIIKNKKIFPKLINNYFNTGDLGYLDTKKNLYIIGRSKDLIIKAGENIYPSNLENLIADKKLIKELCVFGFRDEINGEDIGIAIVKKPKISDNIIIKYLRKKLTNFQFPKKIYFIKKLPKSNNGKILKTKLKDSLNLK